MGRDAPLQQRELKDHSPVGSIEPHVKRNAEAASNRSDDFALRLSYPQLRRSVFRQGLRGPPMRHLLRALVISWCFFAGAAYGDDITPNDRVRNGVIVRAEASTGSERLGRLDSGERLMFVADHPGWWEVRLADGQRGFVSKRWTVRIATSASDQPPPVADAQAGADEMFVHFVDVGQGGGAILEFSCGVVLIDTGGQFQGRNGARQFADYLRDFMAARPERENVIHAVFTTHPHADHLNGLPLLLGADGAPTYDIRNVVDNSQTGMSGSVRKQRDFREAVLEAGGSYSGVSINSSFDDGGVTNGAIDPINCHETGVDPEITVYWGAFEPAAVRALGGRGVEASNPNNNSLVIRIDFGEASFLFTGDLEESAIEDMLTLYSDNVAAFDVDVYVAGHHGSPNATTDHFLAAMTPEIAVISAGPPDDRSPSSGWDHGHPRVAVLDMMQEPPGVVSGVRDAPVSVRAFTGQETNPVSTRIDREIHSTSWNGSLMLRATTAGEYEFVTEN